VTKRGAEDWLRRRLDEARRGVLPGMVRTGATFADAAAEWLRYVEHDRGRKPSTLVGYRSIVHAQLLPAFGALPLESIATSTIEAWIGTVERTASTRTSGRQSRVCGLHCRHDRWHRCVSLQRRRRRRAGVHAVRDGGRMQRRQRTATGMSE